MPHKTLTLSEALAEFKITRTRHIPIPEWKKTLPPDSRWQPGFPGKPACTICKGMGYLTPDVGIHHPQFGKLVICDCVPENLRESIRARMDRLYNVHR